MDRKVIARPICGEDCENQGRFFVPVVDEVIEENLGCGDQHEGFARMRCTNPESDECYSSARRSRGWFMPK